MDDHPPIAVENPEGGETGFCSVLGAGGESFGLLVFRGAGDDSEWDARAALFMAPLLQFTLGARDHVPPQDREVYRALGHRYRGQLAWPVFRSCRPGFLPWRFSAAEARFLSTVLPALAKFSHDAAALAAWKRTEDRGSAPARARRVAFLPLNPAPGSVLRFSRVHPLPAHAPEASFDRGQAKRLAGQSERARGPWQLDLFPAPFGIGAAGHRLRAIWLGLAVDEQNGLALNVHPYLASEPLRPAEFVLETVARTRLCPSTVRVCRRDVMRSLLPLAEALGCRVVRRRHLSALEDLHEELVPAGGA